MPLDGPEIEQMQDDSLEEITDSDKIFNHGRWTEEEHNKFLIAISKYGKKWKKIEEYIGTRSSTQARSHAQKYFNKITEESLEVSKKNIYEISVINRKKDENSLNKIDQQNIFKVTKEHIPSIKRNLLMMIKKQRSYSELLNNNIFKIIQPCNISNFNMNKNIEEESKESINENDNLILKIGENWKSIDISELSSLFETLFQN